MTAPNPTGQHGAGSAEERRAIPGTECLYSASEDGRIFAAPRRWNTGKGGHIARQHEGVELSQFASRQGYLRVNLNINGRKRSHFVHRLVAAAWLPNPLALPQVNHKNANKADNHACNLEWCTASENKRHAHAMGLCPVTPAFLESVRRNVLKAHAATRGKTRSAKVER